MDFAEAIRMDHEAIERNTDPESVANAWQAIASALVVQGEVEEALVALDHAEKVVAETDEENVNYWVRWCRVNILVFSDPTALPAALERLTEFAHYTQAPWMLASLHNLRGTMSLGVHDYEQALAEHRATFAITTTTKAVFDQVFAAIGIINALLSVPDAAPTPEIRRMLSLVRDTRTWYVLGRACELIAHSFARSGRLDEASTMLGYLERYAPALEAGAEVRTRDHEPCPGTRTRRRTESHRCRNGACGLRHVRRRTTSRIGLLFVPNSPLGGRVRHKQREDVRRRAIASTRTSNPWLAFRVLRAPPVRRSPAPPIAT